LIVSIFAHHLTYVDKDGWVCHQPDGNVTVTRSDGSFEQMTSEAAGAEIKIQYGAA